MTEQALIALVGKVAAEVTKEVESAYHWHSGWSEAIIQDRIYVSMIDRVWKAGLEQMKNGQVARPNLAAEEAVLELRHRGIKPEAIVWRSNAFEVTLKNLHYRIYKNAPGFSARPWGEMAGESRIVPVECDVASFVDFLLLFDGTAVDAIHDRVVEQMHYFRELITEEKKKAMIKKMQSTFVESLVNRTLAAMGLYVRFTIDDDEKVHLEVVQMRQGKFEVPIDQLAAWAEDTQKIVEQLEVFKGLNLFGPGLRSQFSCIDKPFQTNIII